MPSDHLGRLKGLYFGDFVDDHLVKSWKVLGSPGKSWEEQKTTLSFHSLYAIRTFWSSFAIGSNTLWIRQLIEGIAAARWTTHQLSQSRALPASTTCGQRWSGLAIRFLSPKARWQWSDLQKILLYWEAFEWFETNGRIPKRISFISCPFSSSKRGA